MGNARREALLLALFTLVAIGLTFPVILQLDEGIVSRVSDHDAATFAWNLWWTRYTLLEPGTNPLESGYIFGPHTIDLRLHTYAPLFGFLTIPIVPLVGAGGALSVVILATIILNGYTFYRLGRALGMTLDGALAAGLLVAVGPALTAHMRAGKPSFVAVWPIALATIFLQRLLLRGERRDGVGLGLSMLAALLIDFQIVLYGLLWLTLFGAWRLGRRPAAIRRRALWGGMLVAGLIVGLPFFAIFFPLLNAAGARDYPVPSAANTLTYSLYPSLFVAPWFLIASFGRVLPLAVLGVAATLRWERRSLLWLGVGALFILLSLGVVLQPTGIPLPFALLRRLPGVAHFRTPYRFTIPTTMAMALATGMAWSYWSTRVRARPRALLLALFVMILTLDSRSVGPFEILPYPVSPLYHRIAAHPARATVLEVPVGLRSGTQRFGSHETLQYYQTIHRKPGVNAMVARVPRPVFEYYRASPALSFLAGEPVDAPEQIEQDLATRLEALGVGWVLLHRDLLALEHARAVERLLDTHPGLELLETDGELRLYVTERVREGE